jgi:hypothetical protein
MKPFLQIYQSCSYSLFTTFAATSFYKRSLPATLSSSLFPYTPKDILTSKHQVQPKDHLALVGVPDTVVAVHTPAAAEAQEVEVAAHNHVAAYSVAVVGHPSVRTAGFGLAGERNIEIEVLLQVES